jgi:hypothetical protein
METTNNTQLTAASAGFPALTTLPDLEKAEVSPLELLGEYWTPEKEGETKRVFFIDIIPTNSVDPESGETIDLATVRFLEKQGDTYRTIRNSSKRLVAAFEVFSGDISGKPFEIRYEGKKKNTTNGYKSDNWSVRPLIVK